MKRCQRCGGRIAKVPAYMVGGGVTLADAWIHVTRYGRMKRFKNHPPEVD